MAATMRASNTKSLLHPIAETLQQLFERDLRLVSQEIEAYSNDWLLWVKEKQINNSAGNLCLHIIGNLNHYIGAVMGQTIYQRNRFHEFAARQLDREKLLGDLEMTRLMVNQTISALDGEALEKEFPYPLGNKPVSTLHFLIHLHSHLNYHLGQITYHRRLV
jgi:uncharacterized damage-inducible protein DinB